MLFPYFSHFRALGVTVQGADADVKAVIAELSEMRYRIATDKELENISDTSYSYEMWNKLLAQMREKVFTL